MKSNEDMLLALSDILSIESVSVDGPADMPYGEGCFRALEYMLKLCADLGMRTKNCDNKIGYAEIGEGEELIGILVHLDVVPAGSGWDFPAFGCTRTDGRIYGRGICDDKGPAIASVFAMKDILDSAAAKNKRIRIIFGMTEERGEWTDMQFYKETEELPAYGFTPDADFPALYGEKGIAKFDVKIPVGDDDITELCGGEASNMVADRCRAVVGGDLLEEEGISAHGSAPQCGENAISKLMARLSGHGVADFYNACIGFDVNGERVNCALEDEQSGKLTLNVGKVWLEDGFAVFALDIRYPVTAALELVEKNLRGAIAPYGATVELVSHMKPVYMDKNGPLISALVDAYRKVSGDAETPPSVIGGGTYARAMDNIVAFGPMLPGREEMMHKKNEYMQQEDFLLLREIYRTALETLLL